MGSPIELLVGSRDDLATATKLLNFWYILVVSDELFEEETNVLSDDAIELLRTFPRGLLVVLDDAVEMVAADTDTVEYELEEELQQTQNARRMDARSF
jgi:hypothetical protein